MASPHHTPSSSSHIRHPDKHPRTNTRTPPEKTDILTANAIRHARVRAGLMVKELAALSGLSEKQLYDRENCARRFSADDLARISAALKMTVKQLLAAPKLAAMTTIADRLLRARLSKNVTVDEAANAVGITYDRLQHIEHRGTLNLPELRCLASYYTTTLENIIDANPETSLQTSPPPWLKMEQANAAATVASDAVDFALSLDDAVDAAVCVAQSYSPDPAQVLISALARIQQANNTDDPRRPVVSRGL